MLAAIGPVGASEILATGPNEAWAIADKRLYHAKEATLGFDVFGEYFGDLSASARDDVWAAGGTALWHYDGTAWTKQTQPEPYCGRLWQSSRTDIWLACDYQLYRGDGTSWTLLTTGGMSRPTAIRGTSGTDVWVQYDEGRDPRHFDGVTWESRPAAFPVRIAAAPSNNELWALSGAGLVHHYVDGAWHDIEVPTSRFVADVFIDRGEVWLATQGGGLLRKR